jgi:protein TonB
VRTPDRDPLGPILALGRRQIRTGALLGIAGALVVHGAGAAQAARQMYDVAAFTLDVRAYMKERLRAEYEIQEIPEPEPPPPPPPEPEPEPEPEPIKEVAPPLKEAPPPEPGTPPPAAAEAANVLTSDPDPNEPLDLTDQGFVVGSGETYAGGITAKSGTSKSAVRDVRAAPTGVGKVPAAVPVNPKASGEDRSRAPKVIGDLGSQCSNMFPAEANAEGINYAVVVLSVTVGTDGRVKTANVASDPGTGFGGAGRQCAMRFGRFEPALDSAGTPVSKTISLRITFKR